MLNKADTLGGRGESILETLHDQLRSVDKAVSPMLLTSALPEAIGIVTQGDFNL